MRARATLSELSAWIPCNRPQSKRVFNIRTPEPDHPLGPLPGDRSSLQMPDRLEVCVREREVAAARGAAGVQRNAECRMSDECVLWWCASGEMREEDEMRDARNEMQRGVKCGVREMR